MKTKSEIYEDSLEEDAYDLIETARDALRAAKEKAGKIIDEHRRQKLLLEIQEFEV